MIQFENLSYNIITEISKTDTKLVRPNESLSEKSIFWGKYWSQFEFLILIDLYLLCFNLPRKVLKLIFGLL